MSFLSRPPASGTRKSRAARFRMLASSPRFPPETKARAALDLSLSLADGWRPFGHFDPYPLAAIAQAHEQVEQGQPNGKVILVVAR